MYALGKEGVDLGTQQQNQREEIEEPQCNDYKSYLPNITVQKTRYIEGKELESQLHDYGCHQCTTPAVVNMTTKRVKLETAMWDQHINSVEQYQGDDDAPCNARESNDQIAIRNVGWWSGMQKGEYKRGCGRCQDDNRRERDKQDEHDNRHEMPA